jgi:hypothetical protein
MSKIAEDRMARLFEDAGTKKSQKRKWQCFVCGKSYNNFGEYKEHIKMEHEEGREFLTCPVETCGAPVRDMKTHFRVKHPKRAMPSGLQARVGVWHDFRPSGSGKKKTGTKKPKFRQGEFESKKSGCLLTYRSGMEENFYNLLEQDGDVESFFAEPFKVPYFYQGKWHNYVPDIRINYIDGSVEIWEVKPANQTHYDQNQAKWAAMNDHAHNMGWEFIVQTEVGLGKLKKKVQRQKP